MVLHLVWNPRRGRPLAMVISRDVSCIVIFFIFNAFYTFIRPQLLNDRIFSASTYNGTLDDAMNVIKFNKGTCVDKLSIIGVHVPFAAPDRSPSKQTLSSSELMRFQACEHTQFRLFTWA